jgi:choline monooxygenase
VSYLTYVWDASRLDRGAGAGLDRVEREDEAVVEGVQRGVRSRLYERGRYSPTRETGVHHFHRLMARSLAG